MLKRSILLLFCVLVLGFAGSTRAGLDPSLHGWWTFDEGQGTIAYDATGNGNDGTLTNDPEWTTGHLAGALAFPDTVNAYVEVEDSPELNPTEAITIAAWINPAWTGNNRIMQKGSSDNQYRFLRESGDNFVFHLAGPTNGRLEGFATPPDGEWAHVTGTYDGSSMKVYYNGEVAGEQDATGQISTSGDSLFIGTKHATAPVGDGFSGSMDDIRLYGRAVAQEEIPAIMLGVALELAQEPSPEDEAIDVPRDTLLAWTPGEVAVTHDVYFGTSFDDVNNASRSNGLGTLLSQGQTDVTYDPDGLLEYGQTYYWRVDEVNGAPDNTVFKGDVWSLTVELFAYPVQNIIATTNAVSDEGVGLENTINGSGLNELDQHSTGSGDMWLGVPPAGETPTIQYEFDGVYKLHEMLVWNYNVEFELLLGFGVKDVTVEYSENGTDWIALGDVELAQATAKGDYAANTTVDFGGVPVKYVRLTVNAGWGPMGQYGLSEVRFLYIPANAREPQPAKGQANVAVDTALNWRAGRQAVSHEAYLGTDPAALALVDTTTGTSVTPAVLDMATTYYWRVDEVNEAEEISMWEGHLWSFTTQDFIVVDDFESYDDEDNVIYESWVDGWVNETGSTVGYLSAPFAEQTIVNSGSQSMPLSYDNAGVATSETDLALAQNWTASGIQSLSLYFYGDAGNSGGELYVKINGTTIAYDGDAANITDPTWQLWNIDLAASGASLSNVSSLTIGIEGAGAQGIVYIDDIRLYP
jgi:Concanavalin A-like lectin/glucanases superfamily